MPRGSHVPQIAYPPLRMVQRAPCVHGAGIDLVECDQVILRVYSVAKTVADCFKFRNQIGADVALEALKDALTLQKATVADIWRFSEIERVTNVVRPYLEALQ